MNAVMSSFCPQILNGSTIRIEAFDADQPNTQNSRVLYSLRGVSAPLFNIDFNTGIVTVAPGNARHHYLVYIRTYNYDIETNFAKVLIVYSL